MSNKMFFYESVFVVRQDASAQDVTSIAKAFIAKIEAMGGKLIKKEYWGLRDLGYKMKKNKKGHYILLGIEVSGEVIIKLIEQYRLNESIIKFSNIKMDKIDTEPSIIMKAPDEVKIN